MRALLERLWTLPWPPLARRLAGWAVGRTWLQRLVIPQHTVGVVGIVRDDRGRVLLLRHTYRGEYPWGLPSGFLERGEQPHHALAREIREETGLRVHIGPVAAAVNHPTRSVLSVVFLAASLGGEFTPSAEIADARFFGRGEFPPLLPDQHHLIHTVLSEEENRGATTGVRPELL